MPLEIFKVSEEEAIHVSDTWLFDITKKIFEHVGVSSEDASQAADVLVQADLRGVDSHGVSNMLRNYVASYQEGTYNPTPSWEIVRERASTATIEADQGLGIIIAPKAMKIAIQKAKQTGFGVVTIRNSAHMGMASYHAMLALEHDMIGVSMSAIGSGVFPTFGSEGRFGTNPIAIAAPALNMHPFVFDIATSIVAGNKLRLAKRLGTVMPAGLFADADGNIVDTPGQVPETYNMIPIGGTREHGSHKGYGFALMVEILSTLLSGGIPCTLLETGRPATHHVAAYDIDAFTDVQEFKEMMDKWLMHLENTPPAPGHERVLTPGLEEEEATIRRKEEGIPLHPEVMDWFKVICDDFSIPFKL